MKPIAPSPLPSGTEAESVQAKRLLLVERQPADLAALAGALDGGGFDLTTARSGREAEACIRAMRFDAIVLDPDLPDTDGFDLVSRVTRDGRTVALVLTGANDDAAPRRAFASGAADFACKPVRGNELLARLQHAFSRAAAPEEETPRLTIDRQERVCHVDGRTVSLTRHERDFLVCLLDSPRHFASYGSLIAAVWGDEKAVETQHLRVLAAQVRRKIESGGDAPALIKTVTGEGFRLSL